MFEPTFPSPAVQTDFFDVHMKRVETTFALRKRAQALLHALETTEPLIAQSLKTPQDVRYHAEGPFMRDHLERMFMALYALETGELTLLSVEELARLKPYTHEIEELQQTLTEHVSWFEAYIAVHDAAKWDTLFFQAPEGSRGAGLGFRYAMTYEPDVDLKTRGEMRRAYTELYERFAREHAEESPRDIQSLFFQTYEIEVKYPHHGQMMFSPVHHQLLRRVAQAHELTDIHTAMLEDIVARHITFTRFAKSPEHAMKPFLHIARVRGYDADDFIDLIQGVILLDFVCGSVRMGPHGRWHEIDLLVQAIKSEHEADPARRAEKLHARREQEHRRRLRLFQEVGLDGLALMELLEMEPGPAFGKTLRQIHAALIGRGEMPTFGKKIDEELGVRAGKYYRKMFDIGE